MPAAALAAGVVEVWVVSLPERALPADLALLDPRETATARAFSAPSLAARYIGGRAAARRLLGRALDLEPAAVPIGREPCPRCGPAQHGRPSVRIPGCTLRFSLSRAGSTAAIALTDGCPVGVDVEPLRVANLATLGRHALSPADLAHVERAPAQQRAALFFRSWCRKEAVTKAAGIGIVTDLRAIGTAPHQPGPVSIALRDPELSQWQVHDLPEADGVAGAVAWPTGASRSLAVYQESPTESGIAVASR